MTSRQLADHRLDRAGRGAHGGHARRAHGDEPARLAAALGARLAQPGRDEPLGFEPLQRGVDVGAPHRSSGPLLDVVGDRDGVGLVGPEAEGGQQDEQLEFGERRGRRGLGVI